MKERSKEQNSGMVIALLVLCGMFAVIAVIAFLLGIWQIGVVAAFFSVLWCIPGVGRLFSEKRKKKSMQRAILKKLAQNRERKEALTSGQKKERPDYGLVKENPVVLGNGIDLPEFGLHPNGIRQYLDDLRAIDGQRLSYSQVDSFVLPELYGQKNVTVLAFLFQKAVSDTLVEYATVYICPEGIETSWPAQPRLFYSHRTRISGMEKGKNEKHYYAILGVNSNATQQEIKLAYRELAKKYHPDVTGGDSAAAEMMIEVNRAYQVLGNPAERMRYDLK